MGPCYWAWTQGPIGFGYLGAVQFLFLFHLTYQLFPSKWLRQELNWHDAEKVRDQINTIKNLGTKLQYGANDKGQLCNLPYILTFATNVKWTIMEKLSLEGKFSMLARKVYNAH